MRNVLTVLTVVFLAVGCASKITSSGNAGAGNYTEDLSVWRPETQNVKDSVLNSSLVRTRTNQYVEARFAINDQVDTILDSINKQNLSKRFVEGYTIQVYSGTKREDALNIKKDLSRSLPDLDSDVQFTQPNFRVRTGKYLNRLEAQKDYLAVKRYFPNAIVIPDRVSIYR